MAQVKFVTWLAGLANKPTPTDTDQMYVGDAGTSKYSTWANVKATLKTYFDTLYAKIGLATGSGLTSNTARLLGRSTAGTGALEEITLGTNLSFTGSTLNAAGGGGGSPGGATTQVQYNNAGAFAGDANLTYDGAGTLTAKVFKAQQVTGQQMFGTGVTANDFGLFYRASPKAVQFTSGTGSAAFDITCGVLEGQVGIRATSGNNATTGYGFGASGASGAIYMPAVGLVRFTHSSDSLFSTLDAGGLSNRGGMSTGVVAKVAAYTATPSDYTIECNATTAAFVVTLFPCAGNAGKMLLIKKMDASANSVTVDANASETIDGALTVVLAAQYADITIQVNAAGTGWNKVSGV
jgi:hypothetical protein